MTNRLLVIINVVLMHFQRHGRVRGAAPRKDIEAWLVLAALNAGNDRFSSHRCYADEKRYSPGMVSGVLSYIPLAIYGSFFFESAEEPDTSPIAENIVAVLGAS